MQIDSKLNIKVKDVNVWKKMEELVEKNLILANIKKSIDFKYLIDDELLDVYLNPEECWAKLDDITDFLKICSNELKDSFIAFAAETNYSTNTHTVLIYYLGDKVVHSVYSEEDDWDEDFDYDKINYEEYGKGTMWGFFEFADMTQIEECIRYCKKCNSIKLTQKEKETLKKFNIKLDFNDNSYILKKIQENPMYLQSLSNSKRNCKEIVLEAVKKDGYALEYASKELKNDKEVVIEAVKNNGESLVYASKELKNDKEVVIETVKNNGYAIEYASKELKDDKEVIMESIHIPGLSLNEVKKEFQEDRDFIIKVLKNDGENYKYLNYNLKKDKELAMIAINNYPYALADISDELKKDKEIVILALKKDGLLLKIVDKELKKDKKIILEAIRNDGRALIYASNDLKKDENLIKIATKTSGEIVERLLEKKIEGNIEKISEFKAMSLNNKIGSKYRELLNDEGTIIVDFDDNNVIELNLIVKGVSYEGRKSRVEKLKRKQKIILMREPNNIYNCNNIAVLNTNNESLGNLSSTLCDIVSPFIDSSKWEILQAEVYDIEFLTKRNIIRETPVLYINVKIKINK